MSRKKLNGLISLFIIILYVICMLVSFMACYSYATLDFRNKGREHYNYIVEQCEQYYIYEGMNSYGQLPLDSFMVDLSMFSGYPNAAVIYDKNAEIVYKTDSYIRLTIPVSDDTRELKVINLGQYLTDDIKAELKEKIGNYSVELAKLDYYLDGDEIIPVNIYLSKIAFSNSVIKLSLTDNEISGSYYNEEYADKDGYFKNDKISDNQFVFIDCVFYNIFNDRPTTRLYNKLNDKLAGPEITDKVKYNISNNGSGGGGYNGNDAFYYLGTFTYDGNDYFIYFEITHSFLYDILTSDLFQTLVTTQTALFVIISVAVFVVANKYYTKNKKLNDAKNAFVSGAAHELKTPLSAIINHSECLLENIAPEKNERYINTIHNESVRMNKLVATLLQYNRIASATEIVRSDCSLSEIINEELTRYKPVIDSKGIALEYNIPDNVVINANSDLIALVADNFLSNAVKHTQSGGRIIVSLKVSRGEKRFSVYNEGKCIEDEYKDNLWDIFYRTDKARNSSDNSTGMGLAICKQILEHHKYKYGFENKSNGVEFYFTA